MGEPRHLRYSRLIAAANAPRLVPQARRLRREVPRLPHAATPWTGAVDGPDPLRLLVLGDSTAAGVGVAHQRDGLPGGLADAIAEVTGRGVTWRAHGHGGATSRDAIDQHLADAVAEPADLLFLSIGANDAIHVRSAAAFSRDLRIILGEFEGRNPGAPVLMSTLPVFGRFELLREPLRTTLFRHSLALEEAARRVIAEGGDRWMPGPPPPYTEGFFAEDRFHPSAQGYREWSTWALGDAMRLGLRMPDVPHSSTDRDAS